MRWTLLAVTIGFFIDVLIGDPRWMYHPVRLIGNGISLMEKLLRRIFPKNKNGERFAGVFLVIVIAGSSIVMPWLLLHFAYSYRLWVGLVIETFMCYQLLALKSLRDESMKVYKELEKGDLEGSRYAVSMIVGRDTKNLTEEGVTKAAVETIAENAADGVIAPLFYMMFGGAVWGFFYKAVNTMDSMVGYKNDKYRWFGSCAAILDDIVNYIPARISGWLMIIASALSGLDKKNASKIFKRDRYNHSSPNSAQTEAVMAGALQIQLAGNACYFGELYEKPTIGDNIRPVESNDIKRANKLLYVTACLALLVFGAVREILLLILSLI